MSFSPIHGNISFDFSDVVIFLILRWLRLREQVLLRVDGEEYGGAVSFDTQVGLAT